MGLFRSVYLRRRCVAPRARDGDVEGVAVGGDAARGTADGAGQGAVP